MKILIITLVISILSFNSYAQNTFYLRCVDADNLQSLKVYKLSSTSKKIVFDYQENGIVQITNFNKGDEILITSVNYKDKTYQRFTKRLEIAAKINEEKIVKPGDTIDLELHLNDELLLERWKKEDELYRSIDTSNLITNVDSIPSVTDKKEFTQILNSRLHFPKHIAEENIQGTVQLSAIVEVDGTLTNIYVTKSINPELDRIALRALRSNDLPRFIPAIKDGVNVRFKIVFPISFNLHF